jgi:hypothetical protein
MTRSVVVLGATAALAVAGFGGFGGLAGFAAQEPRTLTAEERLDRLEEGTKRLELALKRSEATVATLAKQVKTIAEAQERLARAVSVEPSGAVRITGNLRLDNNVLEDATVITCDPAATAAKRQCTCPDGLVTIGIELRPLSQSAYPGPATYNTALVCSRL